MLPYCLSFHGNYCFPVKSHNNHRNLFGMSIASSFFITSSIQRNHRLSRSSSSEVLSHSKPTTHYVALAPMGILYVANCLPSRIFSTATLPRPYNSSQHLYPIAPAIVSSIASSYGVFSAHSPVESILQHWSNCVKKRWVSKK